MSINKTELPDVNYEKNRIVLNLPQVFFSKAWTYSVKTEEENAHPN